MEFIRRGWKTILKFVRFKVGDGSRVRFGMMCGVRIVH
jgi:hypothetical protein